MQRTLLIGASLVVLAAAGLSFAWWQDGGFEPDAVSQKLMISPDTIDFDSVVAGQVAERTILATNLTDSPIEITRLRVVGPFETDRSAMRIEPGDSQDLEIRFKPTAAGVYPDGSVLFESDQLEEVVSLALSGQSPVPGELTVAPRGLAFGHIQVDRQARGLVTLTNYGAEALEITHVAARRPFSVTFTPERIEPGDATTVEVGYDPQDVGDHRGSLTISSSDPAHPKSVVALHGKASVKGVSPALEVDTTALDFGEVPIGQVAERWITVSNYGPDSLSITSVTVPSPFRGAPKSRLVPSGRKVRIPIVFSPSEEGGRLEPLLIHSNDPDDSLVIVSLIGTGAERSRDSSLSEVSPGFIASHSDGSAGAEAGGVAGRESAHQSAGETDPLRYRTEGGAPGALAGAPSAGVDPATGLPDDQSGAIEDFVEPEAGDPGQEQAFAPAGVEDGSSWSFGTYKADLSNAHVGDISYNADTGTITVENFRLPEVQLPFGQSLSMDDAQTLVLREMGNQEYSGQVVMDVVDETGTQVYEWVLELKTEAQTYYTESGPRTIVGAPLDSNTLTLHAPYTIPPGPTIMNTQPTVLSINLNVGGNN